MFTGPRHIWQRTAYTENTRLHTCRSDTCHLSGWACFFREALPCDSADCTRMREPVEVCISPDLQRFENEPGATQILNASRSCQEGGREVQGPTSRARIVPSDAWACTKREAQRSPAQPSLQRGPSPGDFPSTEAGCVLAGRGMSAARRKGLREIA